MMLLMLTAPLGKTSSLCYHGTIHSKHPYVTNTLSSLIESLTKKSVNSTDTDDNNMNTGHQKPPNKTNPEDADGWMMCICVRVVWHMLATTIYIIMRHTSLHQELSYHLKLWWQGDLIQTAQYFPTLSTVVCILSCIIDLLFWSYCCLFHPG